MLTRLWAGRLRNLGLMSVRDNRLLQIVQTCSGPHPPPFIAYRGSFCGSRDMKQSTHPRLVPTLRMNGDMPPPTQYALMGCTGRSLVLRLQRLFWWYEQLLESYVYWTVHHLASWINIDQLDVSCFIVSLFTAPHVSNVSTSIFRSLRLIVVLFHVLYCSVRIEDLALASLFSDEWLAVKCVVVLISLFL